MSEENEHTTRRKELEGWHQLTTLPVRDLSVLSVRFRNNSRNGYVNKEQFRRIMPALMPNLRVELCDRFFHAFNTSADHRMDINDFMKGLRKMFNGTRTEKLKVLFDIFDLDGDGCISYNELFKFVYIEDSSEDAIYNKVSLVKHVVEVIDRDKDGQIKWREFYMCLQDMPVLVECLQRLGRNVQIRVIEDSQFDWTKFMSVLNYGIAKGIWGAEMGRQRIRMLLQDLEDSDPIAVNGMFKSFQSSPQGSATLQHVLRQLSAAMRGSLESKIKFYFDVNEGDHVGLSEVNGSEIFRLIAGGEEMLDDDIVFCDDLMQELNSSGKGKISYEEFKSAARDNDLFLEVLSAAEMAERPSAAAAAGGGAAAAKAKPKDRQPSMDEHAQAAAVATAIAAQQHARQVGGKDMKMEFGRAISKVL